ncbi:MAG: hypothetical protein ACJATT_003816 [Myxococcota bacterium]|jgi:hypothetical protein
MSVHVRAGMNEGRRTGFVAIVRGEVHLAFFSRQRGEALKGLGGLARASRADDPSEVTLAAWITALNEHGVKAVRRQRLVLGERVVDERYEWVHHGWARAGLGCNAFIVQHPLDRAVVRAGLAGDESQRPLLHKVQPQGALFEVLGNHDAPNSASSSELQTAERCGSADAHAAEMV